MNKSPKHICKYLIGLATVIILRLIPHPPAFQPILGTLMPYSKKWGKFSGLIFGALSILSYDLITGTLGKWSLLTIGAYALIGYLSGLYFQKRKSSIKNYIIFAIVGTLIYDVITGFGVGMLVFGQGFNQTLVGQVPFTLNHLLGNIIISSILSPLLYKWIISNPQLEDEVVLRRLRFGW